MKFLVWWEFTEDISKIQKVSAFLNEDRTKNPDKYPKLLFRNHALMDTTPISKLKGFAIVEVESVEQMANWIKHTYQTWSVKYVPIMDAVELTEQWEM
jgi:hypothetical protein